jgi:predicted phosphodiesterase
MTRLAILSDIHGNMTALEAVIKDMAAFHVDRVVVAGDVVNWGPHNVEVVQCVVENNWAVIRGNQELYILDQDTPRAPVEWNSYTISRWTRQQLGSHWLNVIATWPDSLSLRFPDAPTLRIVHGSPRSHFEGIFPASTGDEVAKILSGIDEQTLVCAHTHLPMDQQSGRWHIMNTGSVGMPLMGLNESNYLILDGDWSGWRGILRCVPFDAEPVLRDFERLGFAEYCGATGTLVLEEYRTSRLRVLPYLAWRKQYSDQPDSVLLPRFLAEIDMWAYTPIPYHINR